jgi:hypothetical protein
MGYPAFCNILVGPSLLLSINVKRSFVHALQISVNDNEKVTLIILQTLHQLVSECYSVEYCQALPYTIVQTKRNYVSRDTTLIFFNQSPTCFGQAGPLTGGLQ